MREVVEYILSWRVREEAGTKGEGRVKTRKKNWDNLPGCRGSWEITY